MKKFTIIQPWINQILILLKKEIKNDHLQKYAQFLKENFAGKPIHKISQDEILLVYEKKLLEEDIDLSEWVISRWVYHNSEIYEYFFEELKKINEKVTEIESIDKEKSLSLLNGAYKKFSKEDLYIFSILNEVVFDPDVLKGLGEEALKEKLERKKTNSSKQIQSSIENVIKRQEEEMRRTKESYEKKLSSMKRRYFEDVEKLKEQISKLQKKMSKND